MAEPDLVKILSRLDPAKRPILVQVPAGEIEKSFTAKLELR